MLLGTAKLGGKAAKEDVAAVTGLSTRPADAVWQLLMEDDRLLLHQAAYQAAFDEELDALMDLMDADRDGVLSNDEIRLFRVDPKMSGHA